MPDLSADSIKVIQEMVRWWRRFSPKGGDGVPPADDFPTVSCAYLARASGSGIPALGLGGDQGTGTGTAALDDVPGFGVCEIYQVIRRNNERVLQRVGTTREVFNFGGLKINAGDWVPVVKDKFGSWLALGGPGSQASTDTCTRYVARAPRRGIPGLSVGGNTGTGTGVEALDDVPGSAICQLYHRTAGPGSVPHFSPVAGAGSRPLVYNLSPCRIPAGTWMLVHKDCYGDWYAAPVPCLGGIDDTGTSSGSTSVPDLIATTCCPDYPIPGILYATLTACTGAYTSYEGQTITLLYGAEELNPTTWSSYPFPVCVDDGLSLTYYFHLRCDGALWDVGGSAPTFSACEPLFLVADAVLGSGVCFGTAHVVITEGHP